MREVVRAAVRVAGAVAEGVTVAEGAEDGHRAGVVAAGAAAALRVPGRVVIEWCREFHGSDMDLTTGKLLAFGRGRAGLHILGSKILQGDPSG